MKPTLLILAAGMGSRYGGLKQIDPVGPSGEIIIDYSIHDAIEAGFGKLVFIIRRFSEDAFREKMGGRFDGVIETAYAYQELDACLDGFPLPADREKPWGTGHAILVGEDVIDGPFAVINADDYYGPHAFRIMADYLSNTDPSHADEYSMVGYILRNTLSNYGSVARGVCECDERMYLKTIVEHKQVEKAQNGVRYVDDNGTEHSLSGDETVSMNLWGFQTSIFEHLKREFKDFLHNHGDELKSEIYIPTVVDGLVQNKLVRVKVLQTDESWFGVTYRQDKASATECVRKLIEQGVYPEKLY